MKKEQREALIKKYGANNLKTLEIPKDENHNEFIDVVAVVPSRNVMGQYMKWADTNPKKASEIMVRGCVLSNRELIESDDFMFNTTVSLLAELIPIGQGRVKKF